VNLKFKVAASARSGRRVMAFSFINLALAACAGPPQTFDLVTGTDAAETQRARAKILIAEPTASRTLNSERFVIRRSDGAIAYLTGAQWADRLPRLMQRAMIAAIDGAVRDDADVPTRSSNYRLLGADIQQFEADVARKTAVVTLLVHVSDAKGHVRAKRSFTAEAPFAVDRPSVIADAMESASKRVLANVNAWMVDGARP
jgi:cholesterol transport system auxiliary component